MFGTRLLCARPMSVKQLYILHTGQLDEISHACAVRFGHLVSSDPYRVAAQADRYCCVSVGLSQVSGFTREQDRTTTLRTSRDDRML